MIKIGDSAPAVILWDNLHDLLEQWPIKLKYLQCICTNCQKMRPSANALQKQKAKRANKYSRKLSFETYPLPFLSMPRLASDKGISV